MEFNTENILTEWSYRVPTGIIDLKNDYHFVILSDILTENNYSSEFINELVGRIREKEDKYSGIHGNPPKGQRSLNPKEKRPPKYKYDYSDDGAMVATTDAEKKEKSAKIRKTIKSNEAKIKAKLDKAVADMTSVKERIQSIKLQIQWELDGKEEEKAIEALEHLGEYWKKKVENKFH